MHDALKMSQSVCEESQIVILLHSRPILDALSMFPGPNTYVIVLDIRKLVYNFMEKDV